MKEYELIQALSGLDEGNGQPKAAIGFYHEILGSDGSVRDVDEVVTEKPEIRIFSDFSDLVRIDCVYKYPDDRDLERQYMLLENFFMPKNSINFSKEELYEVNVQNHDWFDISVLEALDGAEDLFVELKNGEHLRGTAYVEPAESLSMFYLELPSEDEDNGVVIDIHDVARLMLDDKEIYSISGEMNDGDEGGKVIYTHEFTINIVSLNPRGKIELTTKNLPLFYSLVPAKPNEPAKILRLTYQKDDVLIQENTDEAAREMEQTALGELEFEVGRE